MAGTIILLNLAGYVGLLLWGTHMVTTGVERAFGSELRRWLGRNLNRSAGRSFLAGLAITALLQSSTATGLMAASFAASGAIDLAPGLAVMLGANVGTTLIAQVLSFNVAAIAPVLVLVGVIAFRQSDEGRVRNLGRVAIGIGLMLLALAALVRTLSPLESAPALGVVLRALTGDPVLAMLLAAVLTWICHSSVAVVLLIVSLATAGVVEPGAPTLALVLGANLGSAVPALIEAGNRQARRLPLGNLLIRASGCAVALFLLSPVADLLTRLEPEPARVVVDFHTAFNLVLAGLFIATTKPLARALLRWLPDPPRLLDAGTPQYLEEAALNSVSSVALANAERETLRLADMVEAMLRGAIEVFRGEDRQGAKEISRTDRVVDRLGAAIRHYLADLSERQPMDDEEDGARAQAILAAVINLEHVGDIVANNLLELAAKQIKRGRWFAPDELTAIVAIHTELVASLGMGIAVFVRGDMARAAARQLLARKAVLRRMENEAAQLHVRHLRERPMTASEISDEFEASNLFLRIIRDLRRVHSHIAALAYPVLDHLGVAQEQELGVLGLSG